MKKIKIILFDADGVLIRPPYYFSKELEKRGYKNAESILKTYYKIDVKSCNEGKSDANEVISPYLKKFGWEGTAYDYFNQLFEFESKYLDEDLMLLIRQFQNKNIPCFLCTDQEKNRAEFLLNEMNFKNIFDGYFMSCDVGYRKCEDGFWLYVIDQLNKKNSNIKTEEIIFFDNDKENIDVALKFGIQAILFKNKEQFEKDYIALNL